MTNVPFAFQLGLFGVILVAGIFFIWRMLTGINDDIAHLRKTVTTLQVTVKGLVETQAPPPLSPSHMPSMGFSAGGSSILRGMDMSLFDDDDDDDDEGEDDGFVYEVDQAADEPDEAEEAAEGEGEAEDAGGKVFEYGGGSVCISEIPEAAIDTDCVTDNTSNPLSKTKLTKMSVEALRDMLADHKLSTEGGKKVLVQRILDSESFSAA